MAFLTFGFDEQTQGLFDRFIIQLALLTTEISRSRKAMTALTDTASAAVAEMQEARETFREFIAYVGELAASVKDLTDRLAAAQSGASAEEETAVMQLLSKATGELQSAIEEAAAALPAKPAEEQPAPAEPASAPPIEG